MSTPTHALISTGKFTKMSSEVARGTEREMNLLKDRCDDHVGTATLAREVVELEK